MDFADGTIWSPENYRWCYARGDRLLAASQDAEVLDRLIDSMKPPGQPMQLHGLALADKRTVIREQIEYFRKAFASKFKGVHAAEICAAQLHSTTLPGDLRTTLFGRVNVEAALKGPVSAWLLKQLKEFLAPEPTVVPEVPFGAHRADVVGFQRGNVVTTERVVAVELKNTLDELERGFAQLSAYTEYATEVYLACSPDLAAQFAWRHVRAPNVTKWEHNLLETRLKKLECGLLLVEGDEVTVALKPKVPAIIRARSLAPLSRRRSEAASLQRHGRSGAPSRAPNLKPSSQHHSSSTARRYRGKDFHPGAGHVVACVVRHVLPSSGVCAR